jgi:FixJ family two-component response regulator
MANARIRVAVVDDDESICRALKRLLHALAFDTEIYASGREFLESFHAFQPDCVILDLHMDGMSGLDLQRHLQRMKTRPPVIIITGHDNPGVRAESLLLGADAFLLKPVDRQLLISAIERLTKEARPLI